MSPQKMFFKFMEIQKRVADLPPEYKADGSSLAIHIASYNFYAARRETFRACKELEYIENLIDTFLA